MTFIGKLLVFLNAILATALLSWALSLYTNRVDWTEAEYRGKYDKADEYRGKKLTALNGEHSKAIAALNPLYEDAKFSVADAERQLAARTRALDAKLAEARGGVFFELERPNVRPGAIDRLDLGSRVQTKVAKQGGMTADLRGLDVLQAELQSAVDATLGSEELGKESGKKGLAAIRKQLTAIDGQVTALNAGIERLRVALVQREDEKRYLDDVRVNSDAQLITLQKRNDQLQDRLKAFGVTRPLTATPQPSGAAAAR